MMALVSGRTAAAPYFNGEVTFGDVLTSTSVLVAALTLYFSFWQDRIQRRRDVADAIRTAAADALAKLERYARLPESIADKAQTLAVETSQMLAKPPASNDVESARDYLWAGLSKNWQEVRAAQREENIELAHVKLFGRRPDAYHGIAETISQLDEVAFKRFDSLLNMSQEAVSFYVGKDRAHYHSAELGNELREFLMIYVEAIQKDSRIVLEPVRRRLLAVIGGTDKQVMDRAWQASVDDVRREPMMGRQLGIDAGPGPVHSMDAVADSARTDRNA
jgi:hypothetical protein